MQWQIAVPALALILLLLGAAGVWKWSSSSISPLSEKASIAVLPFENIGSDIKWDRFADGITEDIVIDLSHSKDLFVVARNSTEAYRGKPADVRDVGRDLGVRYVLEGSIQPSGDQIRVTALLIDTRTGGNVWSDRYDRPATDLFKVQSDVTEKIAATLTGYEGAVAEAERSLIRRKPPSDLTAYDTYLLGMEAKHKVTKEGLDEGERLFRKALEIDPQLARAYVGLAYIYDYRIDLGLGTSVADNLTKLMEAARNAVRLDPNDGETQLVLGHAFAYQGMADQALEQFAKAEALAEAGVNVDTVIQTGPEIVFSADEGPEAVDALGSLGVEWSAREDLGQVSVIGAGMRSHPGVAAKMFSALEELGIQPMIVTTSPIKIGCFVARGQVEQAVQALHAAFELERPEAERQHG
jgi:TolB-like protein